MDEITLKKIKQYLERETGGSYDDEEALFAKGAEKFKSVLDSGKDLYGADEYKTICDEISNFIGADEAQERKLYNFCLSFKDPCINENKESDSGISVENHKFLSRDELWQLCEFVKAHKKDKTVGMVVNQLMYDHNLTAPQIYDEAMISRQDFSRIVNSNKGVGKSKIWSVIIGLHCNLKEADLVLLSAGYARKNTPTDLVIEYFIKQRNYDILAINEVLYSLGLKMLSVYTEVRDKDSNPEKKKIKKEQKKQ